MFKAKQLIAALILCAAPTLASGFDQRQFCDDIDAGKYEPHMKAMIALLMHGMTQAMTEGMEGGGNMQGMPGLCDMKPDENPNKEEEEEKGNIQECYDSPADEAVQAKQMFDEALAEYVKQCGREPNF